MLGDPAVLPELLRWGEARVPNHTEGIGHRIGVDCLQEVAVMGVDRAKRGKKVNGVVVEVDVGEETAGGVLI